MGGRHTTVIDAAAKVVDYLLKMPEVNNVIAGHIKSGISPAQQRIKIKQTSGYLSIMVRGGASIQEIKVFSQNLAQLQKDLENYFYRQK